MQTPLKLFSVWNLDREPNIDTEVFAPNKRAAFAAVRERDGIDSKVKLKGRQMPQPFDAEGLLLAITAGDQETSEGFRSLVELLAKRMNRHAEKLRKANRDWHDDPAAPDHHTYHAPASIQYPAAERRKAILKVVAYMLGDGHKAFELLGE